jgi:hypothetical protein
VYELEDQKVEVPAHAKEEPLLYTAEFRLALRLVTALIKFV